MNRRKLGRLQREVDGLRAAKHNIRPSDLAGIAKKLQFRRVRRGKHPTYENANFPRMRPLSIPDHPTINPYTAEAILDDLEAAIRQWEENLEEQEAIENERKRRKALPS